MQIVKERIKRIIAARLYSKLLHCAVLVAPPILLKGKDLSSMNVVYFKNPLKQIKMAYIAFVL